MTYCTGFPTAETGLSTQAETDSKYTQKSNYQPSKNLSRSERLKESSVLPGTPNTRLGLFVIVMGHTVKKLLLDIL